MPVKIYWLQEPTILANDYTGDVNMDDSEEVIKFSLDAVARNPVYILVDMREAASIHNNVLKMGSVVELINHPNTRWLAVVRPNVLAKFVLQVLVRHKAKVFDTREEAEIFLRERASAEQNLPQSA
jgi:hypothetical protein